MAENRKGLPAIHGQWTAAPGNSSYRLKTLSQWLRRPNQLLARPAKAKIYPMERGFQERYDRRQYLPVRRAKPWMLTIGRNTITTISPLSSKENAHDSRRTNSCVQECSFGRARGLVVKCAMPLTPPKQRASQDAKVLGQLLWHRRGFFCAPRNRRFHQRRHDWPDRKPGRWWLE